MPLVQQFEQLWNSASTPPDVFTFLEQQNSPDADQLLALLLVDQQRRWRTDSPLLVEDYFAGLPDLSAIVDLRRQLAIGEFRARRRTNRPLGSREIDSRFPELSAAFRELPEQVDDDPTPGIPDAKAAALMETQIGSLQSESMASYISSTAIGVQQKGRYRLDRVLGEGAFGRVYLGFDEELQRLVAIKVPTKARFKKPEDADAYLAEARIVASLDHPHIVPAYDVGRTDDGSCYAVSKLIDGTDLGTYAKQQPMTFDQAAQVVAHVAEALQHTHNRGLVHRDIKPANILMDRRGCPYVTDFGLALRDEDFGKEQGIAGTPVYMSPEQARGEGHLVDGRSDIFSLGVVLYELLTGVRPFAAGNWRELLQQIATVEAKPLRQCNEAIPGELERICMKALSKRAADRYSCSVDFADELRHWSDSPSASPIASPVLKIVPKGLRSFDASDSDFFLELLPGPRDRDGLPETLRFWKTRLEETDPDRTFRVGLMYGPSGCGKSSLIKAGLLPRLGDHVIRVSLEATPDETESQLLHGLRRACADLPRGASLIETLSTIRRGKGIPAGRKVVLVLDQFEQWLHAHGARQNTELVAALRQCDGQRVQALLLVRDDFWIPATRLFKELETPLLEGQNSGAVDLCDALHARKVLAEFGKAYGRLPQNLGELSQLQETFLHHAVDGLALDGKVICVRLALFADMMKSRPWTVAALQGVGGTAGVGLTFLEETFSADIAPPEHRLHQKAARAVLQTLLPEAGTDIKGHMRSHEELLQASGYANMPQRFRDVIRILDQELRLITPTDSHTIEDDDVKSSIDTRLYYQLTHDYLVPSLRRWLASKQMETPRGRAELRLAERSALWNAKPESRRLPDWQEYASIRRLTDRKLWTEQQRRMMRQAARYHAQTVVRRLMEADLADVPEIVRQIGQLRKWAEPILRQEQQAAAVHSKAKLHTALALLAVDDSQLDYLYEQLLLATPAEFPILRDALAEEKEALSDRLWTDAASGVNGERRLRAAAALAHYDPASLRWQTIRDDVVQALTRVNPEFLRDWKEALRPVRIELIQSLGGIFRNHELGELQLALATSTLADYAADDVRLLSDLLSDADPQQFAGLFPVLLRHGEAAIRELERELDKVPEPEWADLPSDPAWLDIRAETRLTIEAAMGIVEDRFALCQTMPYAQFSDIIAQLGKHAYRPTRIRSYFFGSSLQVAAVWTRDGRSWQWLEEADAELLRTRDAELRKEGYSPIDVSVVGCRDGSPPRYTAIWEKAETADAEIRVIIGHLGQNEEQAMAALVDEKFNCSIANSVFDKHGQLHGSSLWSRRKDQQKSTTRIFHGPADEFREDDCPGLLLSDMQLSQWPELDVGTRASYFLTTAVWNVSTQFEAKVLHGLSPEKLHRVSAHLVAEGFRPISISATNTRALRSEDVSVTNDESLLTTSVWHRPLVPEEAKDRLAKRQANAAVALLRLGREQTVWPILQHRPDPRTRSYALHRFNSLDAASQSVVAELESQQDNSIRRALLLILGEYSEQRLPSVERERLTPRLLDLYANNPDPGIHGAAAWTLGKWGLQSECRKIDQACATGRVEGSRSWYVSRLGKPLVIIPAPGEIVIGSPPWEADREGGPEGGVEMQRYVRIDHSFALMSHQVTVGEFLRFAGKDFFYRKYFSPEPDCPMNNVSWYDSVAYCNWLNEQEGIPRDQWCYLPNEKGEYAQGMSIVPNALRRTGYRLPTEAEWEFACRAGSVTSRYFGQSQDLVNYYSCNVMNSLGRRTALVGSFKPNDLGLFDMLGNTLEWSHSLFLDHSQNIEPQLRDGSEVPEVLSDRQRRPLRGATLAHPPETIRAAFVDAYPPGVSTYGVSLRLARTSAADEQSEDGLKLKNDHRIEVRGMGCFSAVDLGRSSYKASYKPNFPLFGFGIRPARTMSESE